MKVKKTTVTFPEDVAGELQLYMARKKMGLKHQSAVVVEAVKAFLDAEKSSEKNLDEGSEKSGRNEIPSDLPQPLMENLISSKTPDPKIKRELDHDPTFDTDYDTRRDSPVYDYTKLDDPDEDDDDFGGGCG